MISNRFEYEQRCNFTESEGVQAQLASMFSKDTVSKYAAEIEFPDRFLK